MADLVDCRGLSCPEPVMLSRRALEQASGKKVTVLVSSAVARDNVTRAARAMGWQVKVENEGDDFKLNIEK